MAKSMALRSKMKYNQGSAKPKTKIAPKEAGGMAAVLGRAKKGKTC